MFYLLGILAGCCLPLQTSVNARLRGRTGSPYSAALISFIVGLVFLALLLVVTGEGVALPWGTLFDLPAWIWLGGVCGVIFLTLNILLFPRIGSVQTVILPTLGQILMGLIVDNFGLFRGVQVPLSVLRLAGAVLVIAGVVIVTLAKARHSEGASAARARGLIFWQIAGVAGGMLSATQTAVNGYLGKAIDSSLKASLVSFLVGTLLLIIVCLFTRGVKEAVIPGNRPWWMWIGGAGEPLCARQCGHFRCHWHGHERHHSSRGCHGWRPGGGSFWHSRCAACTSECAQDFGGCDHGGWCSHDQTVIV